MEVGIVRFKKVLFLEEKPMKTRSSSSLIFARIGAQMERDSMDATRQDIECFKPGIFSWWQCLVDMAISHVPPWRRRRMKMEARFLGIIGEYGPMIMEQLRTYEEMFYRWERENGSVGCGSESAARAEQEAKNLATELTKILAEKLTALGWTYRPIMTPRELVVSAYPGHTSVEKGLKYWKRLEEFFASRT